jgi:hypothetical protein
MIAQDSPVIDDVIWIVTEMEPANSDSDSSRDGGRTRNPYLDETTTRSGNVQRVPLNAAKLEQGVSGRSRLLVVEIWIYWICMFKSNREGVSDLVDGLMCP